MNLYVRFWSFPGSARSSFWYSQRILSELDFIRLFNITPEGLHYCEIWTNIGRAILRRNFDVTSGRAAYEACSATWNSGYQLSICSRIEENHGKKYTVWAEYKNSVRTSQETHYVSATKPNRLMLFREIIAVYCENHMEHMNTLHGPTVKYSMLKQMVHIVTTGL
jgi:hypothetical protein